MGIRRTRPSSLTDPLATAALRLGVLSAFLLGPAACSSSPPSELPAEPADGGADAPPTIDEGPNAGAPMPEAPRSEVGGGGEGRELTPSDCQALATRYGAAVRSDEMAKLHPNLTAAQRDQARAAIDRAAEQLETGWRNGCMDSLLGKVADEVAVKCALAAKTVAAFDACLNSPSGGAR